MASRCQGVLCAICARVLWLKQLAPVGGDVLIVCPEGDIKSYMPSTAMSYMYSGS